MAWDYYSRMARRTENRITIPPEKYEETKVKRGLRNEDGTGVLVGLTDVSWVDGYSRENGSKVPREGHLYYRGLDVHDLVRGFQKGRRRGFEETAFLLLFGELPDVMQLEEFNDALDAHRELPPNFTENMILKIPSRDIMNKLQRSILVLHSHDNDPDGNGLVNLLRQSLGLIARFPTIISYGYQAKAHYFDRQSLFIHAPKPGIGTAENILHLIRMDNAYTENEAATLDLSLVLHADHGGGNNSAFTAHVVSSSGTDTYSALSAAVGSLKGPKHGGANKLVRAMIEDIKTNEPKWREPGPLKAYLNRILDKQAFTGDGLIYGMGHAVYTLSDPRAELLKEKAKELAKEKGREEEFELYASVEALTREIFKERKGDDFVICANVDLYSGFVYDLLDIPPALYTPLFAVARVAGWCAHRIEQVMSDKKIIRPAYVNMAETRGYTDLDKR